MTAPEDAMQRCACLGFALTELLVAAALLAIGLLGYVALLVAGLHLERDATNLAAAVTLAADLGERIRANPAAGLGYVLDPDNPSASPPPNCELAVASDAPTRAACDLAEWHQNVMDALPGAVVQVTALAAPNDTVVLYTIDVRWTAWRDGAGGRCSLQLQV